MLRDRFFKLCAAAIFVCLLAFYCLELSLHKSKPNSVKAECKEPKSLEKTQNVKTQDASKVPRSICPKISPLLKGKLNISTQAPDNHTGNWPPTLEETALKYQQLELGGFYPGPRDCEARNTIALIVPCRGREEHLRILLHYTHGILQRQQTRYVIVVVTQDDDAVFNKGQLMNAGFRYVINNVTRLRVDCFFFHDVDVISEDDRILYKCRDDDQVFHMAAQLDVFGYKFCCGINVGAILAFSRSQFEQINGFPNVYYGWGGEDSEMKRRIVTKYKIYRLIGERYRFKMIKHPRDKGNAENPKRFEILKSWRNRWKKDGLNSLAARVTSKVEYPTHTRLFVRVPPETPPL